MRYTDIAIIGGGLAGSTAAAMLGRAGISAVLIDPHETYPADFRVEKPSGPRTSRAIPADRSRRISAAHLEPNFLGHSSSSSSSSSR